MEPQNHTEQIRQMEDSLFKAFPTVNRVSIEVKDDFGTEVIITLGDAELFSASEEQRQQVTARSAGIVKHVFKPEDVPEKGTVIFLKEEKTLQATDAAKKSYEMNLGPEKLD